ncbi:hypothetical protein F2Q70_00036767 [Brassica cretica]|uniref:Uncharacterized protein n=1 Tax=Brassica cretica TaxID=69181 RepID=A0A8S9JVG6_BRACR|nr:hypothetical protein F2Q68_00032074 [Brassica cretica]KAF2585759.1 hypothetical protein F2Q70_00036767 [Brassica cretica]
MGKGKNKWPKQRSPSSLSKSSPSSSSKSSPAKVSRADVEASDTSPEASEILVPQTLTDLTAPPAPASDAQISDLVAQPVHQTAAIDSSPPTTPKTASDAQTVNSSPDLAAQQTRN